MRNEDSGIALQLTPDKEVAPSRAARPQFDDKTKPAAVTAPATSAPRLDPDSKAALS